MTEMKIAGMQPYLFPYIGYFQIIYAADRFVIADNAQFINRGWINRNRILVDDKAHMITAALTKDCSHLKINERFFTNEFNEKGKKKILKTIHHAYKKAPNFKICYDLVESILMYNNNNVAEFTKNSLKEICSFLEIETLVLTQSELDIPSQLEAQDTVIQICKKLNATRCINAIGGMQLYSAKEFEKNGVDLKFIKIKEAFKYKQFNDQFIPNLSIIDVMMFNSQMETKKLLTEFDLIDGKN